MKKTYISSLLVAFIGTQTIHAEESLADVFASLDAQGSEQAAAAEPAVVEGAQAASVTTVGKLDALLEKGVAQYKDGEYKEAEAYFEAALDIDGYNRTAMRYLKRLADKESLSARSLRATSRAQSMREVDAMWPIDVNNTFIPAPSDEDTPPTEDELAIMAMEAKLKSINIPSLDFREANINDVSLFLQETARRDDPAKKGVNILLYGMEDGFSSDANNITISIRDNNLFEALGYITQMASLKFEIMPKAVAIMPVNYVRPETIEIAEIHVMPEVGETLSSGGADDGGMGGLFGDDTASEATGPTDVTSYFSIVDWPDGCKAQYEPTYHVLTIRNTPTNIEQVEKILAVLEDKEIKRQAQQVMIEAKFVEYQEGALEELGFEWTLYDDGEFAGFGLDQNGTYYRNDYGFATEYEVNGTSGTTLYADPASGYTAIQNNGMSLFGGTLRNNSTAFDSVATGVLSTLGGTPATMVFANNGKFPLDVAVSAMEQEGTADVLSAPRVTTKSGAEAIIRVVEVHRYPQDYDVETGQRTAPVVKPQDWEDYDLGVVLKVTPVVDADNNTIDLDLQPDITEFKGFDSYIVGYNSYETGDSNSFNPQGNGLPLYAEMPYFQTRTLQTQVTIEDGHTVIMGGLVDERTETFRDQVPILGDIPYLGRLFRSEGSRSRKKNLVISVKATQVDARGQTSEMREAARTAASVAFN